MTDEIKKEEVQEEGPRVLGELTEQESFQFQAMRKTAADMVYQLGNLEVQKARVMGNLQDIETHSRKMLDAISVRLGVAEGVRWQIQDNKVILVGQPPLSAVPDSEPSQE